MWSAVGEGEREEVWRGRKQGERDRGVVKNRFPIVTDDL